MMEVRHFIILSSSYSNGYRIGFDIINPSGKDEIYGKIQAIERECGDDIPLSLHSIITSDYTWESVQLKDKFFSSVVKIYDLKEFIETIKTDRELTALDVTRYVISNTKCTHLKLQKLLYLCHADYLCETRKPLFTDMICALPLGPVVSPICDLFKGTSTDLNLDDIDIQENTSINMPARSKILFTRDGGYKLRSIDRTLNKYKSLSAYELVNITHQPNSPWSVAQQRNMHRISDELILKYHMYE